MKTFSYDNGIVKVQVYKNIKIFEFGVDKYFDDNSMPDKILSNFLKSEDKSLKFLKDNCKKMYVSSYEKYDTFETIYGLFVEIEDKKLTEYYLKFNKE